MVTVPTIPNRTIIPWNAIHSVVEQITANYNPQKIILFGSYAHGIPKSDSDVDLLVVMDMQLSEMKQAAEICTHVSYHFGLDLIVCTSQKLAQRLEWGDSFLKGIIRRGIIRYESLDA